MTKLFQMFLHYLLVFIVMVERLMRRQKIKIVNIKQLNIIKSIQGPIVFAPTHCGKYDIQVMTEVLWKYRWSLLSGDPYDLPGTIEGYWLKFNGVVYVDRDDKGWRKKAKQEMYDLLSKGENLMLYPEGTWNFSPNKLVLPLFRGIADLATATNATIIPFGLEIDDKTNTYYVIVGKPVFSINEPLETLQILRNQMATLKWHLIEQLSNCKAQYDQIELNYNYGQYIDKRLSECSYMSFDLIWKYARKEKWQIEEKQIQEDFANVQPTMQNAFLFNKRLK